MSREEFRAEIRRLAEGGARLFGNVAIAAAALSAPLVVVVGELTDQTGPAAPSPAALHAPASARTPSVLRAG